MSEIAPAASQGPTPGSAGEVQRAISQASRQTGVRFDYLLDQAQRESGLRPDARASTSSATGLYQFVEQTWLRLVHEQGPRYGMAAEAGAVQFDGQRYGVADPADRQRILGLRLDPGANALMAGEYARENYERLDRVLDRPVVKTDLAIAHFLGGDGASRFLTEMDRNPARGGADAFPVAARANRNVFFNPGGGQKSLADIYRYFERQGGAEGPGPAARPTPGLGHFMAAVPEGRVGPMLSAPGVQGGGSLWQVFTHPAAR